ncbi:hypothetical protein HOB87_12660 [Candidatus Woesearchaeota archaeon]|nr:hypothetical protein [Candidatus Woesearchaeota archaeon]
MNEKQSNLFLIGLAVFVFIVSLSIPTLGPLIHPDSSGYLDFDKIRTSIYPVFLDILSYLDVPINKIPIVQSFFFSLSVYYLLGALDRIWNKKRYLIVYVVLLVGNVWLISLHNAILTESIYISLNIAAMAALINFFLSGSVKHITIFSFMIGLAAVLRPSGIVMFVLFPIIIFTALNYLKEFRWSWIFAIILPIAATQILESSLYRGYHGDIKRGSILPIIIFGKGAMINSDFQFNGPYKDILEQYSREVDLEYGEVGPFIDKIPYFWLRNQSLPNYEIYAQFNVLRDRRDYFAQMAGVDKDDLLMELGKQRIFSGIDQWIKNSFYHYAASWALRVTSFPPFVKEYNNWINHQTSIPFNKKIKYLPMKGDKEPSMISMVAFPGLLISGVISGLIGIMFIVMLLLRKEMPLMFILSGIFSISVHGTLIFSSFVNVATPRYTTTQFPILLLALIMFIVFLSSVINKKLKSK